MLMIDEEKLKEEIDGIAEYCFSRTWGHLEATHLTHLRLDKSSMLGKNYRKARKFKAMFSDMVLAHIYKKADNMPEKRKKVKS